MTTRHPCLFPSQFISAPTPPSLAVAGCVCVRNMFSRQLPRSHVTPHSSLFRKYMMPEPRRPTVNVEGEPPKPCENQLRPLEPVSSSFSALLIVHAHRHISFFFLLIAAMHAVHGGMAGLVSVCCVEGAGVPRFSSRKDSHTPGLQHFSCQEAGWGSGHRGSPHGPGESVFNVSYLSHFQQIKRTLFRFWLPKVSLRTLKIPVSLSVCGCVRVRIHQINS